MAVTWLTRTTLWSCNCWMIISHTVVFPDAVPPETPDLTKEQCRSNKNKAHETEAEASEEIKRKIVVEIYRWGRRCYEKRMRWMKKGGNRRNAQRRRREIPIQQRPLRFVCLSLFLPTLLYTYAFLFFFFCILFFPNRLFFIRFP